MTNLVREHASHVLRCPQRGALRPHVHERRLDDAVQTGEAGLIVAGVGDGNIGAPALAALADAAARGVAIVRSSRTGGGVVERNIEVDDDRFGFVAADELNPQKARVLLALALTRTRNPADLQSYFYTY